MKVGEAKAAKDTTLFHTLKRGDVRHDSAAISHEQGGRAAIDKVEQPPDVSLREVCVGMDGLHVGSCSGQPR
jgi:hypothetical protein